MAETNSLLNCRTGNCTGGSNPPFSAKRCKLLNYSVLQLKRENALKKSGKIDFNFDLNYPHFLPLVPTLTEEKKCVQL